MHFSQNNTAERMPSLQGAACFLVSLCCILACLLIINPSSAFAEGSKDLVAQGGYRPYIEQYGSSSAGESQITEIGVYAQAGETLYFGSSVRIANLGLTNEKMGMDFSEEELTDLNENHIIVCSPAWDKDVNPNAYPYINGERDESVSLFRVDRTIDNEQRGFIAGYADELAGPILAEETTASLAAARTEAGLVMDERRMGYTPHVFTADTAGVYHFRFCSVNESAQEPWATPVGEDENFELNQGSSTVAAWDVSVYSAQGELQSGRVFVDELYLSMGANVPGEDVLASQVYVLTEDGYEYQVDFNGLDPFNLKFFSNLRGMLVETEAGYQSLYHSVRSYSRSLADLVDNGIYGNIKPTDDLDRSHRIFFNPPDSFVLERFTGSKTLSEGSLTNTVTSVEFDPLFNPEDVDAGTIIGYGGSFSFYNEGDLVGTSYQITLDLSTDEMPDNKVVLSNALVEGENVVSWDGRDRYGRVVPAGVYEHDVVVEIKGGEAHFPLIDADDNRNGTKITLMNDIPASPDGTVIRYNNLSNKQGYQGSWSEENWTVIDGVDANEGVDGAGGVLAYDQGEGSYTALDLWTYQALAVSVPCRFEVYGATLSFAIAQQGETKADDAVSVPVEGDRVDLQLQWRIQDSSDTWQDYDGARAEYHRPVASVVRATYDPSEPLFTGLEQYAGRNTLKGDPLAYQYRVVPVGLPDGCKMSASNFEAFDMNGVAYAQVLIYSYLPDAGTLTVLKEWEGDSEARLVRPQQVRVKIFQRAVGSGSTWEELKLTDEPGVTLSADDGWCADVLVPLSVKGVEQEYFLTMVGYTMNGSTWVSLDSNTAEFLAGVVSPDGEYNAPGYSDPRYVVDGGTAQAYWSANFGIPLESARAQVMISDVYKTAFTVSHVWEQGVDKNSGAPVVVQLFQDGIAVEGAMVSLTEEDPSYTFEGLEVGHAYATQALSASPDYAITQGVLSGESGYSLTDNNSQRGYRETYTSTYQYTALTVTKEWETDAKGQDPVEVQVGIAFNDGREPYEQSVELTEEKKWEHTIADLPVGGRISVEEGKVAEGLIGLYGTLTGTDLGGYTQTLSNEKERATLILEKSWRGDEAASSVRPDAVKLQIYFREKGSDDPWVKYDDDAKGAHELTSLNRWTTDVAVERTRDGKDLEYYVTETSYKGHGASSFTSIPDNEYAVGYDMPVYSLDGGAASESVSPVIDFENRVASKVASISTYTTTFTVVGGWQQEAEVTTEIMIQLQKDGKDVVGATATLDPENTSYTFSGLETGYGYSAVETSQYEGVEVSYTEVEGEDGFSTISTEVERGYYQGITIVEVVNKGEDQGLEAQATENGIRLTLSVFALIALGVGVYVLVARVRNKRTGETHG